MYGDYTFLGTVGDLSLWAIDDFVSVLDPGLSCIGAYSRLPLNYPRVWAEEDLNDHHYFSLIGELLAQI